MSALRFQFLDYRKYKNEIDDLRKMVFVEELNREDGYINTPWDEDGIHLGTFDGDRLFSITSALFMFPGEPRIQEWEMKPIEGDELVVQVTKRASLKEYRGQKLNELAVVHLGIEFLKVMDVAYYIIAFYDKPTLQDQIRTYNIHFGFEFYKNLRYKGEDWTLIKLEGEENYRKTVSRLEPALLTYADANRIEMQPLTQHLRTMDHLKEKIKNRVKGKENREIVFG
jgi:hypothetical protein